MGLMLSSSYGSGAERWEGIFSRQIRVDSQYTGGKWFCFSTIEFSDTTGASGKVE